MPVSTPRNRRQGPVAPAARSGVEPSLGHLRQHLIHNRADRGPCPTLSRLKADFLPASKRPDGLEERRAHVRLCHVCASRLHAWKRSWQFPADQSLAWSRLAAHLTRRHGGRAARELSHWIGRAAVASYGATRSAARYWQERRRARTADRSANRGPARSAPHTPSIAASPVALPLSSPHRRSSLPPAAAGPKRGRRQANILPLVVVEEGPGLPPPTILAESVEALGGGLAVVRRIEDVLLDRDWKHVRTVLLARPRPLGEWRGVLDRIEGPDRTRRAFALLPRGEGLARLPSSGDVRVLAGPLSTSRWEDLLGQSGWVRPETVS